LNKASKRNNESRGHSEESDSINPYGGRNFIQKSIYSKRESTAMM